MALITLKKGYQPRTNKINDEKGQQNWLRQEVGQIVPKSINILIPIRIRRNYLSSGRSQLMYLFIKIFCNIRSFLIRTKNANGVLCDAVHSLYPDVILFQIIILITVQSSIYFHFTALHLHCFVSNTCIMT